MINLEKIKQYFFGEEDENTPLNRTMKNKQAIFGICFIIVMVILALILHALATHKKGSHAAPIAKPSAPIDGVLSSDFTEKNELSALEQEQQRLDLLEEKLKSIDKAQQESSSKKNENKAELLKEINGIIDQKTKSFKAAVLPNGQVATVPASTETEQAGVEQPESTATEDLRELETATFSYRAGKNNTAVIKTITKKPAGKTPVTYVPAGTFAKGVLLEGADANASVNGQSDTVPILVRILSTGTLPNGHHSHLKGCFVLASIYGDISSERGEARLTKISCTRKDGTILERSVKGYLSFAGKEGIKGQPVMRNGDILAMAGVSGFLSGVGSSLQQSTQTQSVSPLGTTSSIDPNQVWQGGVYGGAGTAMNKLANYYIKRADQYHPIIEIGSGTVATVIFQEGFSLNDDEKKSNTVDEEQSPSMSGDPQQLKEMMKQAQVLSKLNASSPFSNVSGGN